MPDSNYSFTLYGASQAYLALGYSVIPLRGDLDSDHPKVPAAPWKTFQSSKPSEADLTSWFVEAGYQGVGIVTGRVSNLLVLDFDIPGPLAEFRSQHPHLAETRTVQTRRGFHLYFHLPSRLVVPSLKGNGVDLLSDGCYVVAPPTIIEAVAYRVTRGGIPRALSASDVHPIRAFIQAQTTGERRPVKLFTAPTPTLPPQPLLVEDDRERGVEVPCVPLSQADLVALYQRLAPVKGRNNALFQASLKARDAGWDKETVRSVLQSLHADHPGRASTQNRETKTERLAEAIRTIDSVFSRPARKPARIKIPDVSQLPNSVREKLLQLGQTATLRVIEGLLHANIPPGSTLTYREIRQHLKGMVGDWSVRLALQAVALDGKPILIRVIPSPKPPTHANAASHSHPDTTKKCFFGGAKKPTRSPKHRPPVVYQLPSIPELCGLLGVSFTVSDPITPDDLASARKTRQAVHREFIKRRPGIYPRRWLAKRLGMSLETLDDYNRTIPISFKPMFDETPISWSNLKRVPDFSVVKSAFLQDETGKRYPALRKIAAHLLRQGKRVTYKQQDANYYWYGDSPPDLSVNLGMHPNWRELEARQNQVKQYVARWRSHEPAHHASRVTPHSRMEPSQRPQPPATIPEPAVNQQQVRNYRRKMDDPDREVSAQRLYNQMRTLEVNPKYGLSLKTARQVIDTYRPAQIEWALSMLRTRPQIENPVGYLITVLRSGRALSRS